MSTTVSAADRSRRSALWLAAAALAVLIFLWQWPFFFGDGFGSLDLDRVAAYALHHGYILAWMLVATAFTRTLSLRTLATFWLVGLFPVMAVVLFLSRPLDALVGGGQLASAFLGPLVEELIKPLPVLALFAYRARRGGWQPSATDGLLLGFLVGAGFGFHEDAGYGRVWGSGFSDTPWNLLFPTVSDFRGSLLPYHDTLSAVVGLSIGFGFLFRRYRFAWILPVAVWIVVLIEHVTGNLADIGGSLPAVGEVFRVLALDGQAPLLLLVLGIAIAVIVELRIVSSIGSRDPLFPAIPLGYFLTLLQQRPTGWLERLQTMRVYARSRRSAYYTVWSAPGVPQHIRDEMAATLYLHGLAAGVPVDRTFADYDAPPVLPDRDEDSPAAATVVTP